VRACLSRKYKQQRGPMAGGKRFVRRLKSLAARKRGSTSFTEGARSKVSDRENGLDTWERSARGRQSWRRWGRERTGDRKRKNLPISQKGKDEKKMRVVLPLFSMINGRHSRSFRQENKRHEKSQRQRRGDENERRLNLTTN